MNAKKKFMLLPLFIIAVLLGGWAVMLLWNAILPEVTSAKALTYWQAVGLLILSKILFGGWRGKPGGYPNKHYTRHKAWREKWANMSEAERAQLKEKWRQRCGGRKADDKAL